MVEGEGPSAYNPPPAARIHGPCTDPPRNDPAPCTSACRSPSPASSVSYPRYLSEPPGVCISPATGSRSNCCFVAPRRYCRSARGAAVSVRSVHPRSSGRRTRSFVRDMSSGRVSASRSGSSRHARHVLTLLRLRRRRLREAALVVVVRRRCQRKWGSIASCGIRDIQRQCVFRE